MAHAFTITDGSTTFSLTTTNCMLVNYPMAPPTNEGGKATNVTESISIMLYAATPALMQAATATLERLLEQSRRGRYNNIGPIVRITAQLDSDTAVWRSRIYDARLELKENSLAIWGNAKMEATLIIERDPYWEGALTQIPLTNGNGSNNTSGLKIYNCGDSTGTSPNKRDNYVQVAANDVAGDVPAPVRLELTNTTGGSLWIFELFAATNAFSDPANFPHIMEGESTIYAGYGSAGSDSTCSGGSVVTTTGSNTWYIQAALSGSLLAKCAGQDFHILMRTGNKFSGCYVQPQIYEASGTYSIRTSDETPSSVVKTLYDLGVMSLPPGGYSTAYGALRLAMRWRTGASQSVLTDYWALFPTTGFRKLQMIATMANNATLVDDPIEDRAYVLSSGAELPYVVRRAGPVLVWPNTLQRLYFLWSDNVNNDSVITQTMTIKAYYRPRRVTIG